MIGIAAEQITKKFSGFTAIGGVSLDVPLGRILGLVGVNGAGKTTTMRLLSGFLPPDSGRIAIMGMDLSTNREDCLRHIGYLPEGAPHYNAMRVIDYLRFAAELRGIGRNGRLAAIESVVEIAELQAVLNHLIETLSKGFKRRVALAQAMISNPPVLILDEPTDGLDPNQKHDLRAMLKKIAVNKAILVSTHILEEIDALCDSVAIMHQGRIVANVSAKEFSANGQAEHNFRKLTTEQGS